MAAGSSTAGLGTVLAGVIAAAVLAALGWLLAQVAAMRDQLTILITLMPVVQKDVGAVATGLGAVKENQTELATVVTIHDETLKRAFPTKPRTQRAERP